jgi:hypothetical protein
MSKRSMLGVPWSENRKRAFEELAREFSKYPAEFARTILEEVMQCHFSIPRLRELGLLSPWAQVPRPSFLVFSIETARAKLSGPAKAEWQRELDAIEASPGHKAPKAKRWR